LIKQPIWNFWVPIQEKENPMMTKRALRNSRKLLLLAAGSLAVAVPPVSGQVALDQGNTTQSSAGTQTSNTTTKLPEWDVISVKPVQSLQSCTEGSGMIPRPNGIHITCLTPQVIVKLAYGIWEDARVLGAPDWDTTTFYNIDAKVDAAEDVAALGKLSNDQRNLMLQTLLEERFKLKVHHETKELPIYALVVAKSGSKLKEAAPDEAQPMMRMKSRGEIVATGSSLRFLPNLLLREVGRTVVDKTGLTGKYDFTLQFTPLQSQTPDSTAPSIFTAIQEQLGLKLESQKAPMDTIIIDHIERPSEN
jgi:uncharacterized protein (TIGR03435 family)